MEQHIRMTLVIECNLISDATEEEALAILRDNLGATVEGNHIVETSVLDGVLSGYTVEVVS